MIQLNLGNAHDHFHLVILIIDHPMERARLNSQSSSIQRDWYRDQTNQNNCKVYRNETWNWYCYRTNGPCCSYKTPPQIEYLVSAICRQWRSSLLNRYTDTFNSETQWCVAIPLRTFVDRLRVTTLAGNYANLPANSIRPGKVAIGKRGNGVADRDNFKEMENYAREMK